MVPCSQCFPLEEDLQTALSSLSGPQPFGSLATVSCPEGLQSGDGSVNTSVSCLPGGWEWCLDDFNCSCELTNTSEARRSDAPLAVL